VLIFEAVLAFLETLDRLLDGPEPNDACSINEINLMKGFGIGKVLSPENMDEGGDFDRQEKCEKYIKSRLILAPISDRRSRAARMILGLRHTYILNIEASRSKVGRNDDGRMDVS
jgi:hypothetical protein